MDCNYKIGDIIKAKVVEVKPYAAFLSLPDGTNGMVHISELSDSYIRDIEKFVAKGDELKIMVLTIDSKDNFIRGSYKQVPENEKFTTHMNSRKALMTDEEDFEALKRNIPDWINQSLERHNK